MQYMHHHMIATKIRIGHAIWPNGLGAMRSPMARSFINSLRVEARNSARRRGEGCLPRTLRAAPRLGGRCPATKIYCTGAPGQTRPNVWARTDEDPPRVGAFLIPAHREGIRIVETWDHLGTARVGEPRTWVFEDVRVPLDDAVDIRLPAGWGNRDPVQAIWNVTLISGVYTGVAEGGARLAAGVPLCTRVSDQPRSATGVCCPRMQEAIGAGSRPILTTNRSLLELLASAGVAAGRASELGRG